MMLVDDIILFGGKELVDAQTKWSESNAVERNREKSNGKLLFSRVQLKIIKFYESSITFSCPISVSHAGA